MPPEPMTTHEAPPEIPGPELDAAERALCRLEGAVAALPDARLHTAMHLRGEAALSSTLSGDSTSVADLLEWERAPRSTPGPGARCLEAMRSLLADSRNECPPADAFLESHHLLGGRGRHSDKDVEARGGKSPRGDGSAARAFHTLLHELIVEDTSPFRHLPSLVRIGMAQGRIESHGIFSDGNGRIARMAVPALMKSSRGLALGTSGFLLQNATAYAQLAPLGADPEHDGDWLPFFLTGLAESAAVATEQVRQMARIRQEHIDAIAGRLGHATGRGIQLLDRLFRDPVATVADVRKVTGTSYVATNHLVSRFVELGILEEMTGFRRNRVFFYAAFTRIFDLDPGKREAVANVAPAKSAEQRVPPVRPPRPRPKVARRRAQTRVRRKPQKAKKVPRKAPRRPPALSDHLL